MSELRQPTPPSDTHASSQTLQRLRALPVAVVGDVMDRLGIMNSAIGPVWGGARLAGRAVTVWTRAGDNKTIHEALPLVKRDDVIVVNGEGDVSRALIGELIGRRAQVAGAAGFVIDGAVRDATGLEELGVPTFARAVTPAGPYKFGPGRINVPVAVGGVVVQPGDYVSGDEDGVVVISPNQIDDVLDAAEAKARREIDILESIGRDAPPSSEPAHQNS
ncbi:methyltransferase [Paramicrobacterium chengjingii]|uniref:Putative 4-hydroxy-4-methyl-2-oxoglutarate aldolase n=1 Tax=Paramicrobacterium chengjingii TaxID=2769067 RepID=A0ABX6YIN7_9MICO|nr:methyltransferase [Microbacterium chengjingii]QPZ38207.1 methyltransferase [Microbacterium chengjingii]